MARIARVVVPDFPHHVVQRGVRRMDVFFRADDRQEYLNLLSQSASKHALDFLAWCLTKPVRCEREVLAHVVGGKLNKQIAFDLGAAERTIKAHRANIMDKLGVQSVAELVRLAQELGIQPLR